MPANLPPQYFDAEKKYREARTTQEKIQALKEMLAIIPKHKGTEKLQAELKSKIARLKEEQKKRPTTARAEQKLFPKREGAARVTLVGPPNSGKSQLLASLTRARPQVAPYPYSTFKPEVGMMEYEDIQIQIVDMPPITKEKAEYWQLEIIRQSDLILIMLDATSPDPLKDLKNIKSKLEEARITLIGKGERDDSILGPTRKRSLLILNKIDLIPDEDTISLLKEIFESEFPVHPISAEKGTGLNELKSLIFRELEIIRVYTKEPGKPPDMKDPLILKKGSTVLDAARGIHKDFEKMLKYARLWGSAKFDGQRVERTYILQDKDIVEFHI